MAVVEMIGDNKFAAKTFIIDTADDVANLPTNVYAGSTALCIATSELYIINSSGTWSAL